MPKATSGGASNAWEQDEPQPQQEASADAAGADAQSEAVEAQEPAVADAEATPEPDAEAEPLANGGLVTAEEAPLVIDPNDTPPTVLPTGWTAGSSAADPVQVNAPQPQASEQAPAVEPSPPGGGD